MSLLTPELLRELVAEARLAPSVHNIQPTRWRMLADGRLALVDDTAVRAPVADPTGHDVRVSHGAALEGMSLALNRHGLSIADIAMEEQPLASQHAVLCRLTIGSGAKSDPLADSVSRRMSWRSTFAASSQDEAALEQLVASREDIVCIRDRKAIADIAGWADEAELSFTRENDFRRELLTWMRLSPSDPLYLQSGLNREALAMSAIEARGARLVLGPLFPVLDKIGLAAVRPHQDLIGGCHRPVLPAAWRGPACQRSSFLPRMARDRTRGTGCLSHVGARRFFGYQQQAAGHGWAG
jgi:nitroreductase